MIDLPFWNLSGPSFRSGGPMVLATKPGVFKGRPKAGVESVLLDWLVL